MAHGYGVAGRERFAVLDQMLLERRAEIRNRLRTLRETVPAEREQIKDPDELGAEEVAVETDIALAEMGSAALRQIDEALRRLHEGRYGRCAECDEVISEARLRALPFALLCRDCQEVREGEAARSRSPLALEEGLSISARNDRTPSRFARQQTRIWDYAVATTSRALAARAAAEGQELREPARSGVSRIPLAAWSSRRDARRPRVARRK